jgi:hypothetical protein
VKHFLLLLSLSLFTNSSHAMLRALLRPAAAGRRAVIALPLRAAATRLPSCAPARFLSSAEKQDNATAAPAPEIDPTQLTPEELATIEKITLGERIYSESELRTIARQIAMRPGAHNIGHLTKEEVIKQVGMVLEKKKLEHLALLLAEPAARPALREQHMAREIEDIKSENGEDGSYDFLPFIQTQMLQAQALNRILEQQAAQAKSLATIQGLLSERLSALDRQAGLAAAESRAYGQIRADLFEIKDGIRQIARKLS